MSDWRRQQYEHNKALCDSLDHAQYPDWAVTALFYAAVVLVDEIFDRYRGQVPFSHKERSSNVTLDARTRNIDLQYRQLKTLSEAARYCQPYAKCTTAQVDEARQHLQAVEEELLPKIT